MLAGLAGLTVQADATPVAPFNVSLEANPYLSDSWGLLRNRDDRGRDSQGCFRMSQISATSADQIGLSSDIVVSNAAELQAAIASAADGTTIGLRAGNYGTLTLSDFSKDLTLVADRDAPAVLDGMSLRNVQGLTFDGLVFDYVPMAGHPHQHTPFGISGSQDITIRNALFDGGDAFGTGTVADGAGTGVGLSIGGSSGITLEESEIAGFWKGLTMGGNSDVVLRGNEFHDIRSDPVTMGQMQNTLIENNHFHSLRHAPGTGDHSDMIQLINAPGDTPSAGLIVRGNVFNLAGGDVGQALFLSNNAARDGGPETFYRDFLIEDNLIINSHRNSLVVGEVDGLVLRNNTVLHADPVAGITGDSTRPFISVDPDSRNVVIMDNVTTGLTGPAGQPDWAVAGNIIVQKDVPGAADHYSAHFIDPTGDFALDIAKLTVRPDSVIAQQGAGASVLQYSETSDSLTPRIVTEVTADNRAVHVFDAAMTTGPDGPVDDSMAAFLWTFSDGTTAQGQRVEHHFTGPGTHTGTLTVTMADGTTATTATQTVIRDTTVMSFDAAAGALMLHGPDGPETLVGAPLVDHPDVQGRFLDLGALDTAITLPSTLLDPVHVLGRMEIDMRIAGLPGNTGAGEIMRQHTVFVATVKNDEIILAVNQEDGKWVQVTSSGAQMDSGMWRDITLVHDAATARLEIWIDGHLNAATDGVGPMLMSNREVTLGGAFSRTAFDGALERLEFRTDPDLYDFAPPELPIPGAEMPLPGGMPEPGAAPAAEDETSLDRPDLDTLRAEIDAGTSDLTLRERNPDKVDIWADRGGSLLVGDDNVWERFRDRDNDDVMHGGAGADQFVFSMRHMEHAQTDRVLDLDFNDGDVLRFLLGNGAGQLWFRSNADILKAVEDGHITAALNGDESALALSLTELPQHVVEIDLHAGFSWTDMA